MGVIRPPHLLKPTKNSRLPTRVIMVDTETTEHDISEEYKQHELKLGVACYMRAHKDSGYSMEWLKGFTDNVTFWDWSLSKCTDKQRVVIMAHNLDFDFQVLGGLNTLSARNWYASNLIVSGQVDIWSFSKYKYKPNSQAWKNYMTRYKREPIPTHTLLFLDLMNYFKMSLKSLGKSMGIEKLDIDFNKCTDEELLTYCVRDVEIMIQTWITWIDFLRENDLGCWGRTLPSQAMNAFRHRFMKCAIYIHSHDEALDLEREAYCGGRTECFQIGKFTDGPYYLLDVNSLYPSVMINNLYPTGLRSFIKHARIDQLRYALKHFLVVARVKVNTNEPFIPKKDKGRLIFPIGTFWTSLCTPELMLALERHCVIDLDSLVVFDADQIFYDYVNFFWTQRLNAKQKGDTAYSTIYKLLMNSLYGKFGQTLDEYIYLCDDPEHDVGYYKEYNCDEKRWIKYKRMNGKVEVFDGKGESYNSFPAISGHVTSYARLKLWSLIKQVPPEHRYYCDTDSLIVDATGYKLLKRYLDDTVLGALHLEKQSQSIVINNVKDYIFDSKRKLKGVQSTSADLYSQSFVNWHQVSLRSVLWGAPREVCLWKKVVKNISGVYRKGVVHPDGYVTPFLLQENVAP